MEECKGEIHSFLKHEDLNNVPLLVVANKQDLPNVMSITAITGVLDLHSIKDHNWCKSNQTS